MSTSTDSVRRFSRRRVIITAAAVAVIVSALIVAGLVVPGARTVSGPEVDPEQAVPALQVAATALLVIAVGLALVGALSSQRSGWSTTMLTVLGTALLFLGFALSDAAVAFANAGGAGRTATFELVAAVALAVAAGIASIATAFVRPRSGKPSLSSP